MTNLLLWRRITRTDMMDMTGRAAPSGTGGGAKHIPLGVNRPDFDIIGFLGAPGCEDVSITIEGIPGLVEDTELEFACNPDRRGGEWRITRQHSDRYPLWREEEGFPGYDNYDEDNPPVIFIIKIQDKFHARFCMFSELGELSESLRDLIGDSRRNSGIVEFSRDFDPVFDVGVPPPSSPKRIPERTTTKVSRYIRDSRHANRLKPLYGYKCCLCQTIIERPAANHYVECCHIRPLNQGGHDSEDNLLILCPNHHVEFDSGALTLEPSTHTLKHINPANPINGRRPSLRHRIDETNIEFHYTIVFNRRTA
jgi:hypothetical protein